MMPFCLCTCMFFLLVNAFLVSPPNAQDNMITWQPAPTKICFPLIWLKNSQIILTRFVSSESSVCSSPIGTEIILKIFTLRCSILFSTWASVFVFTHHRRQSASPNLCCSSCGGRCPSWGTSRNFEGGGLQPFVPTSLSSLSYENGTLILMDLRNSITIFECPEQAQMTVDQAYLFACSWI